MGWGAGGWTGRQTDERNGWWCVSAAPRSPLTTTPPSESQLVSPHVPFAHPYLSLSLLPPIPHRWHTRYPALTPQYGETPLHKACEKGLTEVALALVEKGANVDAANKVRPWGGEWVGDWADRRMSGMDGGVS